MTNKDDDTLARFIALENLVASAVSRMPDRAEVIDDFEIFQAQQAAMQAATGMPPDFATAFREAHENLLRLVSAKQPG